jgi:hypothetical protein
LKTNEKPFMCTPIFRYRTEDLLVACNENISSLFIFLLSRTLLYIEKSYVITDDLQTATTTSY